ncbi:hypothetical protein ACFSCX_24365 [Bacillus salitolerans]|uniref:Uncharacterized protein n=1 Tax=Bacillus salitolerans TaxID=1437434 RepID=A0ABW4LX45_9BACI
MEDQEKVSTFQEVNRIRNKMKSLVLSYIFALLTGCTNHTSNEEDYLELQKSINSLEAEISNLEKTIEKQQVILENQEQYLAQNKDKIQMMDNTISFLEEQNFVLTLREKNSHYEQMYKELITKVKDQRIASVVILYLEAMRTEEQSTLKKYSYTPEEKALTEHIKEYKNIQFPSMKIINTQYSKADPELLITLSYDELNGKAGKRFLALQDYESIKVYESDKGYD